MPKRMSSEIAQPHKGMDQIILRLSNEMLSKIEGSSLKRAKLDHDVDSDMDNDSDVPPQSRRLFDLLTDAAPIADNTTHDECLPFCNDEGWRNEWFPKFHSLGVRLNPQKWSKADSVLQPLRLATEWEDKDMEHPTDETLVGVILPIPKAVMKKHVPSRHNGWTLVTSVSLQNVYWRNPVEKFRAAYEAACRYSTEDNKALQMAAWKTVRQYWHEAATFFYQLWTISSHLTRAETVEQGIDAVKRYYTKKKAMEKYIENIMFPKYMIRELKELLKETVQSHELEGQTHRFCQRVEDQDMVCKALRVFLQAIEKLAEDEHVSCMVEFAKENWPSDDWYLVKGEEEEPAVLAANANLGKVPIEGEEEEEEEVFNLAANENLGELPNDDDYVREVIASLVTYAEHEKMIKKVRDDPLGLLEEEPSVMVLGYSLHGSIGFGSSAKVYKGVKNSEQCKGADIVAVKMSTKSSDALLLEHELIILGELKHPNIVYLHTSENTDLGTNLILDYCDGGDVHKLIRSRSERRLSERLTRRLMRDLAAAFAYMRDKGIAHRDIKPRNLVLTGPLPLDEMDDPGESEEERKLCNFPSDQFRLKLCDFGFATRFSSSKHATTMLGTPTYAAPEVVSHQGHGYDPVSSDLWSVGVTMFEMLVGQVPFCGSTNSEIFKKSISRVPPQLPSNVTSECTSLFKLLLDLSPKKRCFQKYLTATDAFVSLGCGGEQKTTAGAIRIRDTQNEYRALLEPISGLEFLRCMLGKQESIPPSDALDDTLDDAKARNAIADARKIIDVLYLDPSSSGHATEYAWNLQQAKDAVKALDAAWHAVNDNVSLQGGSRASVDEEILSWSDDDDDENGSEGGEDSSDNNGSSEVGSIDPVSVDNRATADKAEVGGHESDSAAQNETAAAEGDNAIMVEESNNVQAQEPYNQRIQASYHKFDLVKQFVDAMSAYGATPPQFESPKDTTFQLTILACGLDNSETWLLPVFRSKFKNYMCAFAELLVIPVVQMDEATAALTACMWARREQGCDLQRVVLDEWIGIVMEKSDDTAKLNGMIEAVKRAVAVSVPAI